MTDRHTRNNQPDPASLAGRWKGYEARLKGDFRAEDRGEARHTGAEAEVITYGLLTADGTLGFVSSSVYELRRTLDEQRQLPAPEREHEDLPAIPGLQVYYADSAVPPDRRPANDVANALMETLDPEHGPGHCRGAVAFINTPRWRDITPDQRAALLDAYRAAHSALRATQTQD